MLSDENYTPDELAAISSGYAMLIDESSDVLQDLKNVVNVTGMSLSDAERLAIIDNAYRSLMNYRNLVLLHGQDHLGELPEGKEEERHGPGDVAVRNG